MKISLKKLMIHPRQSEETTAFDAEVWIDGKKVGYATNNGRGGEPSVTWIVPSARRREIEEVLKARVPAGYRANGTARAIEKIVFAAAKRAFNRGHAREDVEGVSIRDAQEAASFLGDQRTAEIVGYGGLSGATEVTLRLLVKEAIRKRVKQAERARKKTPAQLDRDIAEALAEAEVKPISESSYLGGLRYKTEVYGPGGNRPISAASTSSKTRSHASMKTSDPFTPDELALLKLIKADRKVRRDPIAIRAALSARADKMGFASHGDEARWIKKMADALTPASRGPTRAAAKTASVATFSVMLQLPDDPRFSIPGMTLPPMYGPVTTGLQRDEALALAKKTQGETGRHVRVYVDGRNYDTADFGPRPMSYQPRSMTAKILPGVPMAR